MFTYCGNNPIRYVDSAGRSYEEAMVTEDDQAELLPDPDGFASPNTGQYPQLAGGGGTSSSKCPNSGGRHGGLAHRSMVDILRNFFDKLGYNVSSRESRVYFDGSGKYRYPDLIVSSDEGIEYYIQVGRQNNAGLPIPREQRAYDHLTKTGIEVWFVPYN